MRVRSSPGAFYGMSVNGGVKRACGDDVLGGAWYRLATVGAGEPWSCGSSVLSRFDTTVRRCCLRGAKPRELLVTPGDARRIGRSPAEQLIEELWEGEPPPSGAIALRVHVNRLRQVLELDRSPHAPSAPAAGRAPRLSPRIEPDELDAQRFERLVRSPGTRTRTAIPLRRAPAHRSVRPLAGRRPSRRAAISARRGRRSPGSRSSASSRSRSWPTSGSRWPSTRWSSTCSPWPREFPLRERLTGSSCSRSTAAAARPRRCARFSEIAGRSTANSASFRRPSCAASRRTSSCNDRVSTTPDPGSPSRRARFGARRRSGSSGRRTRARPAHGAVRLVGTGSVGAALVAGSAGIGKTTLVEDFCSRCAWLGADVLVGAVRRTSPTVIRLWPRSCGPSSTGSTIADGPRCPPGTADRRPRARRSTGRRSRPRPKVSPSAPACACIRTIASAPRPAHRGTRVCSWSRTRTGPTGRR